MNKKNLLLALSLIIFPISALCQNSSDDADHQCIDLGLPSGTKWAACNLGADSPSGSGNAYGWASIEPGKITDFHDSLSAKEYGGNPQYDAATALWGKGWATPSAAQARELSDKCKWTWTKQDGIRGYKVTGPNGNFIFLPACGLYQTDFSGDERVPSLQWSGRAGVYQVSSRDADDNSPLQLHAGEEYDYLDDYWSRPIHYVGMGESPDWLKFIRPVKAQSK